MTTPQPVPVWARPPTPARRRTVDRSDVIAAAIAVADADGLDAVSMRRVAGELDARVMSLYSVVGTKDDLLDLMFDELAGRARLGRALPRGWRAGLRAIAQRVRESGLAHPWSIELLGRRMQLGPNTMALLEEWVGALDPLRLPAPTAWRVVTVVNDYVVGYVAREAAIRNAVPTDRAQATRWHAQVGTYFTGLADSGQYPHLESVLRGGYGQAPDSFDTGLEWLLDSISRRYRGR